MRNLFNNFPIRVSIIILISFLAGAAIIKLSDKNPITKETVTYAEQLIGLNFSDAEKDSMVDALNSYLKNYDTIRAMHLNNSIPPALLFNPIPEGFNYNIKKEPIKFSSYSKTIMPAKIEDLAYYSIGQLAELIRTKKVTSVQLTKMYLDRLKKYDPILHCVVTFTDDLAIKQAKQADDEIAKGKYRGLLHGIPYGAKDLLAVKGYRTTWGAAPYKDQIIDLNATVIQKLEDAGAVLCAKLSMGELAMDDVWFGGKTRNPWDTTKGSSGSSAGSASAVSAGLLPFAIGTETWGSIVSPSTVCGTTGLRPTYGRVSRYGAMALCWSMDKIGPICRNVEDCAIVLNTIYGADGKDQSVYNFPFNYNPKINLKNLKIGYLKTDLEKDSAFKKQNAAALETFKKLGANLIPIDLPKIPVNDIAFIVNAESAAAFDELTVSNRDDLLKRQKKDSWPNIFRSSQFIPAVEYINANRVRFELIQKMAKLMTDYDIIIAPPFQGDISLITNLTGHPCVVVPDGFSDDGTPSSITFIGNLFDEGKILAVAKTFQDATKFNLKHPPLTTP